MARLDRCSLVVLPLVVLLAGSAALAAGGKPAVAPAPGVATAAASEGRAGLRRPLRLPILATGEACPRDPGRRVSPNFGLASGDGPVYPTLGEDGRLDLAGAREEGGWYYVKVLWFAAPEAVGPVLVRGGRLDAPGEVRFGDGPNPAPELRLGRGGTVADAPGWRHWPSFTRLREPGCYAYQIDGRDFSTVVVFAATGGDQDAPPAAAATPAA